MNNKTWFITGVSQGLGYYLIKEVAQMGHTVIGTVRDENKLKEINSLVPGKTFGYTLDVNHHQQVEMVIEDVIHKYGTIDILVNNAGYGLCGAVEEMTMEEARAQMETNFFGALALTKALLPFMRNKRSGHIIQISSIAGISSSPGLSLYNASKYALEGFSEGLYRELAPLGIHVTIVEPGPFRTSWAGSSMKFASKTIDDYVPTAGMVKDRLAKVNGNQPGDPVKAAHAIIKVTETEQPPLRLALGKQAVDVIRKKMEMVLENLEAWKDLSINADFN